MNITIISEIIKRHILPKTKVFSDGWSSYCNLKDHGYNHYVVEHKYFFKKVYRCTVTDEILEVVHTNTKEGNWKHLKVSDIYSSC